MGFTPYQLADKPVELGYEATSNHLRALMSMDTKPWRISKRMPHVLNRDNDQLSVTDRKGRRSIQYSVRRGDNIFYSMYISMGIRTFAEIIDDHFALEYMQHMYQHMPVEEYNKRKVT